MRIRSCAVICQSVLVLVLKALPVSAAAEEFKYYVWMDEEGIVHAQEEAPKGVDYEIRIIEDINANVVPVEDFHPYRDLPVGYGEDSGNETGDSASSADSRSGNTDTGDAVIPEDPDVER